LRNHLRPGGRLLTVQKELVKIGDVSHYYTNIEVAVVELLDKLKLGDEIMVKGATTEFTQLVESIQIEHEQVTGADAGDSIGLLVRCRVRAGDQVFRLLK
jgi:putative protease